MKKLISLLLVCTMVLAIFAGCGAKSEAPAATQAPASSDTPAAANSDTPAEPAARKYDYHKIAVMWGSFGAGEMLMKDYLETYAGPYFNCEFVFSEALKNPEAGKTFVEQAFTSGCEAVINFYTDGAVEAARAANEYGMYFLNNSNRVTDELKSLETFIGGIGSGSPVIVAAFGELAKPMINDGKEHNIVIVSGGAGQGNQSHKDTTIELLKMVEETYSTSFGTDLTELATSAAVTEAVTDKGNKVLIYPGYPATDTWVPTFSQKIQGGDYDLVFVAFGAFPQLVQPIAQVEEAFNLDIKMLSIASIGDQTAQAFENGALDAAVVNPYALYIGSMFAIALNALEGNADKIQDNGTGTVYGLPKWTVANAEEYNTVSGLDQNETNYAVTVEDIASLLYSNDASVNYNTVNEFITSLDTQTVLAKVNP